MLKLIQGGIPAASPGEAIGEAIDERRGARDELAGLARAAGQGDPKAARTLIFAVGPTLLRTARRILGHQHPDVEDVAQEAAMALVEALPDFRGDCSVLHFASRVTVLTALAVRRRLGVRAQWTPVASLEQLDECPDGAPTPLQDLMGNRRRAVLRRLLEELPSAQAEVLALYAVLEFTADEIATATATPVGTVRSRLRLAKRALRARIVRDIGMAAVLEGDEGSAHLDQRDQGDQGDHDPEGQT